MERKEEWRDIVGYVGLYKVSDAGRVKSLPRKYFVNAFTGKPCPRHIPGCILKPYHQKNRNGALARVKAALNKNGEARHYDYSFIVARAFIDPDLKEEDQIINIDGNLENSRVDNLRIIKATLPA